MADLGGLVTLFNPLTRMIASIQGPLAQFASACERAAQANKDAAKAMSDYQTAVKELAAAQRAGVGVKEAQAKEQEAGKKVMETGKAAEAAEVGAGGMAAAGAALGAMAGAATAAVGAIQEVVGKLRGFVDAISPSTIMGFDRAVRDLTATIGTAFVGVFQTLTGVVRQIAGIILPIMESIKPVVDQLIQSWAGHLIPVVKLLAGIIEALMPVFRILATVIEIVFQAMRPFIVALQLVATNLGFLFGLLEIALMPLMEILKVWGALMEGLGEIMAVVQIVFKTIAQTLLQFIQSLFKGFGLASIMETLANATKKVIEVFLIAVAMIAKAVGATTFLNNLIGNLKPKTGATAAIQGVGIKSLEQITKDMAVAAAGATGEGEKKGTEDYLKDMAKLLEDIRDGKSNNPVVDKLEKVITAVNEVVTAINKSKEVVKNAGRQGWRAFGYLSNPAGQLFNDVRSSGGK